VIRSEACQTCELDPCQCEQDAPDDSLRSHLRALHCWEQDFIDGEIDEELTAQHTEAHDNAEKWEGIFNLHRIAYPHTYYDRRTVRP
jgi:hypothetical protein